MSKAAPIISAVTGVLGLAMSSKPKAPVLPPPAVPAPPAPTRRTDTGATVIVGANDVKNQRVSGTRRSATSSSGNVLGGLGRGAGLNL